MASAGDRKRGSVRVRGGSVKGTDRAARRTADKVLARLQAEVDGQRSAQSTVTLGYTIDEWIGSVEIADSTRDTDIGYVERTTSPG